MKQQKTSLPEWAKGYQLTARIRIQPWLKVQGSGKNFLTQNSEHYVSAPSIWISATVVFYRGYFIISHKKCAWIKLKCDDVDVLFNAETFFDLFCHGTKYEVSNFFSRSLGKAKEIEAFQKLVDASDLPQSKKQKAYQWLKENYHNGRFEFD